MKATPSFFFVHVMKTGGTTFVWQLRSVFRDGESYPFLSGQQQLAQYSMIDELRKVTPETRRSLRIYCGHFPFVATTIVEPDVTMTLLRDPIERTVSILRHFRRASEANHEVPLEELYEHPLIFPLYIHNYQAKLFAMTTDDKLESSMDVVDVDDARLRIAMENLERVDVLGLTHRHDEFLEELQRRFGWQFGAVPDMRVSTEGWGVTESFRRQIAADNAAEIEFYQHALALVDRRKVS